MLLKQSNLRRLSHLSQRKYCQHRTVKQVDILSIGTLPIFFPRMSLRGVVDLELQTLTSP